MTNDTPYWAGDAIQADTKHDDVCIEVKDGYWITSKGGPRSAPAEDSMLPKIKVSWLIWAAATVILLAYVAVGFVASHVTTAKLDLSPGSELDLSLFRLTDDYLTFDLIFKAKGCEHRPELGEWRTRGWLDGVMSFDHPGADVRIRASVATSASVIYQAMPMSGYCGNANDRHMTPNLAVAPGVWRKPAAPEPMALPLHAGTNKVRLDVTTVEPPLVGEIVEVVVFSPVGPKNYQIGYGFLVPGLWLWPLFALCQTAWLLILACHYFARRRQRSLLPLS